MFRSSKLSVLFYQIALQFLFFLREAQETSNNPSERHLMSKESM